MTLDDRYKDMSTMNTKDFNVSTLAVYESLTKDDKFGDIENFPLPVAEDSTNLFIYTAKVVDYLNNRSHEFSIVEPFRVKDAIVTNESSNVFIYGVVETDRPHPYGGAAQPGAKKEQFHLTIEITATKR